MVLWKQQRPETAEEMVMSESNEKGRCESCRWWHRKIHTTLSGSCRFNPPVGGEGFPVTDEHDWCRQFNRNMMSDPNKNELVTVGINPDGSPYRVPIPEANKGISHIELPAGVRPVWGQI
jgi:hypothetical protein